MSVLQPRRLIWSSLALLVIGALAYTLWLAWRVQDDLSAAEISAQRLQHALHDQDAERSNAAIQDLRVHAHEASARTSGGWWSGLTHVPVVGDDAGGVRALSTSLDTIASDGVQPLVDSVDELDNVAANGRINPAQVEHLQAPIEKAHAAFASADDELSGSDSSGYVDRLRTRFDRYSRLVSDAERGLASASTASKVLPMMLGADGARNYLLVFQNNAEIRATGGLPGSWALVHADQGRLSIVKQGAGSDFGQRPAPVLKLTSAERWIFGEQLGTYFLDANFTPDFPRAAQLMSARFGEQFRQAHLDGVVSLDPVALSYLLEGTGPVQVRGLTLTSDNVVDSLLNKPYRDLGPQAQDALFRVAARAIFQRATSRLDSPLDFVQGLERAADEGRFLVASFDPDIREQLAGTRVEGALAGDDGKTPHVDIALNDGTGSKMSYYLRYWAEVKATECSSGQQVLAGSFRLNQQITPAAAAKLPAYITGGGSFGTTPGEQLVVVPLIGPYGGSIDRVLVNGRSLGNQLSVYELHGRPVLPVAAQLSSRDETVFNFTMHTAKGQTGDIELGMTPSIVPGNNDATFKSAC